MQSRGNPGKRSDSEVNSGSGNFPRYAPRGGLSHTYESLSKLMSAKKVSKFDEFPILRLRTRQPVDREKKHCDRSIANELLISWRLARQQGHGPGDRSAHAPIYSGWSNLCLRANCVSSARVPRFSFDIRRERYDSTVFTLKNNRSAMA